MRFFIFVKVVSTWLKPSKKLRKRSFYLVETV